MRPPRYGYGKHIPDDVREKTTGSRVVSSLRKAAEMCMIFLGINISHETLRKSVPPMQEYRRMESSGYFSYDEQYVNIDGVKKYRFLLKDAITAGWNHIIHRRCTESLQYWIICDGNNRRISLQ